MQDDQSLGFSEIETAWIPLADGTRLAARLWLPADVDAAPAPAVLEFLPYRRRDVTSVRDETVYPEMARRGFAGVRVDARGTGDSDGIFDDEYSEQELSDIDEAIAWIAAQPWCNGNVGMQGISWGGFNGLQAAARRPPALKAVISMASTVERFADDIHYKGGCQLSAQLYWSTTMLGYISRPPDPAVVGPGWRQLWAGRLERIEPLVNEWLGHQRRDALWEHGSICEDFGALQAPALVIAGWADGYRNTPWEALAGLGAPSKAVTGPWIHKYPHFAWPRPRMDYHGEAERWWGRWLKGEETGAEALPPHRLYLSEGVRPGIRREDEPGRWIAVDPARVAAPRRYHLTPGALAERAGEGTEIAIRTPLDVGTAGGEYFSVNCGPDLPDDQRADDARSEVFETPPLAEAVDVIGRPVLRLRVSIDAPVGTLVARLVDVHPDGMAHRVSLGVLNLTHRHDSAAPQPMEPGVAEIVEIALDVTGYRFLPGHRIRLAVSTAYFPLILSPPTDVTARVSLDADALLTLPIAPFEEIEVPAPAGTVALPDWQTVPGAADDRRITHSRAEGRTRVEVIDSTGEMTQPQNGMVWSEDRQSRWSITRGDPLSVTGEERYDCLRRRDGLEVRTSSTSRLAATATHWIVESRLVARVNGEEAFDRMWRREIPRDLM